MYCQKVLQTLLPKAILPTPLPQSWISFSFLMTMKLFRVFHLNHQKVIKIPTHFLPDKGPWCSKDPITTDLILKILKLSKHRFPKREWQQIETSSFQTPDLASISTWVQVQNIQNFREECHQRHQQPPSGLCEDDCCWSGLSGLDVSWKTVVMSTSMWLVTGEGGGVILIILHTEYRASKHTNTHSEINSARGKIS